MNSRGFSLAEVVVVVAIIAILAVIGVGAFVSGRQSAEFDAVSDGIVSVLEKARSDALAGKGGTNFGVKINASSYVFFAGSSYNAGDSSNITYQVSSGFTLSTTLGGAGSVVIFSRLTGTPSSTGTVTITRTSPSATRVITVASQGSLTIQ